MKTTISSKVQVVVPQSVRVRHRMRAGEELLSFGLSNGDILLRRIRKPKKSLVWHLRRLGGVKLERKFEPVREIAW